MSKNKRSNKSSQKVYYTHYDDEKPYKIIYKKPNVYIYQNEKTDIGLIGKFKINRILLGKDSSENIDLNILNPYDSAHFKKGNTLLLDLGKNEYLYVGEHIFKFKSLDKIIEYFSPIIDIYHIYPYAIDRTGNVYELSTLNVIKYHPNLKQEMSFNNQKGGVIFPHDYFIKNYVFKKDGNSIPTIYECFPEIKEYYIDDKKFTPLPTKNPTEDYTNLTKFGQMYVVYKKDMHLLNLIKYKTPFSKTDYIKLINRYNQILNFRFEPLQVEQIHESNVFWFNN